MKCPNTGLAFTWRNGPKVSLKIKITSFIPVGERYSPYSLIFFNIKVLWYIAVDQDNPEDFACNWNVNRTTPAYSYCVNCNYACNIFFAGTVWTNALKKKKSCMEVVGSDRNTSAAYTSIHIAVCLIMTLLFRAKSLFQFSSSTKPVLIKVWIGTKISLSECKSLCLSIYFSHVK